VGLEASVRIPTQIGYKSDKTNFEIDTSSIVQKENKNNSDNYKVDKLFENHQMRDLYNRKKKLDYWVDRIHKDLDVNDKQDALKFLEIMQEKDQSILTITLCIGIIIQIKNKLINPSQKLQNPS
jgi:hypothetical protein